jgi:hypothetical protein
MVYGYGEETLLLSQLGQQLRRGGFQVAGTAAFLDRSDDI